jgi:hypothetical protein
MPPTPSSPSSPAVDASARPSTSRARRLRFVSVVEQPDEPHLRLYTVDDERLWESRPRLGPEEFALDEVTDEEWDRFYAALAEV